MKIINRQVELDKPEEITVEFIENALLSSTETPLRWSIVKVKDKKLTVDAVLIAKN